MIRIPREFELPGNEAILRKQGERLLIEPVRKRHSLAEMLDRLANEPPLDEAWPEIDDPPPEPVDF
jgi:antitoxin VapB